MRAFTIIFVGAMLGAVSLAAVGAVSTISQNHYDAVAVRPASDIALAQSGRDREALLSAVAVHAGKATGDHGWGPFHTPDR